MLNFNIKKKLYEKNKINKNYIKKIINDIIIYGDFALKYYIKKIDGIFINSINNIIIKKIIMKKSYYFLKNNKKKIIKEIYIRLKKFHLYNYLNSWQTRNKNLYGQKIISIEKICIYIPGGLIPYQSSIFMNSIPSTIYKTKKLTMITPIKNSLISNLVLAIAYICNIKEIIFSGGVHTLTAIVYGTNKIEKHQKISGPGNYYISESKKFFFGNIGIDMIAGPSELIILNDKFINPKILLFDFYSQLEHDKKSSVIVICNNNFYIKLFFNYIYKNLKKQKNKKNIFIALNNSCLIYNNFINAINYINFFSSEHIMICIKKSEKMLKFIKNCGTIFLNYKTSITYGDYYIGPSHVIPTNKSSRFFSSLNCDHFCKKISIIKSYNNFNSSLISSYISKKENFFCHSYSSIIRK